MGFLPKSLPPLQCVHAGDLRHRASVRLLKADGVKLRPWHASPDIRPRLLPAATLLAPASLPWQGGSAKIVPPLLRRFQAALRKSSNDPRVAVIRAAGDPPINPLSLQALTLSNPCVAVRAVRAVRIT